MNTYLELGLFPLYIRSLWSPQGTIGRLYDPWCEGHWSDPLRDGARFSMIRTDLSVTAGSHACLVRDLSSACSTGRVSYEAPFPLSVIYEEQYCWLLSSIPTSISEVSHLNRILSSQKFPPDEWRGNGCAVVVAPPPFSMGIAWLSKEDCGVAVDSPILTRVVRPLRLAIFLKGNWLASSAFMLSESFLFQIL